MRGIYVVGGYPDIDSSIKAVREVANAGFDFVELGMPFSDPLADGEVIAAATHDVIARGITASDVGATLKELDDVKISKYVMTYANVIYRYGLKRFSTDFQDVLDGLIIADAPFSGHDFFYKNGLTIPLIPFLTPAMREEDIIKLKEVSADFIYYVSTKGITGSKANFDDPELKLNMEKIRKIAGKKVVIGFGVKNRQDTMKVMEIADGYVIGTEAVKRQADISEYREYLQKISE